MMFGVAFVIVGAVGIVLDACSVTRVASPLHCLNLHHSGEAPDNHADDVTTGLHLTYCQAAGPHGHGIVITFASAFSPASENFRE
jgi:hypothetical protein